MDMKSGTSRVLLESLFYILVHKIIHMYKKMDIMDLFFETQEKSYHIREVARLKGMSPMTARKLLKELVNEGLLQVEKGKLYDRFSANEGHDLFRVESRSYFMRRLFKSGLVGFLERKLHLPRAMVLFGSCSKGEVLNESDVDLFLLSDSKKEVELGDFEEKLGREIQLIVRTPDELEEMKDENPGLLNEVLNGAMVNGYLEVFS